MNFLPKTNKSLLATLALAAISLFAFSSCTESDDSENEYANWKSKNSSYFLDAMKSAADSIAYAKQTYGSNWEQYSNTRQYLSYSRQNSATHSKTDSIAVQIIKRGTGTISPFSSDSVRIAYRTLLIPTSLHPTGLVADHSGVSDDYDKVFDLTTTAPSIFKVSALVRGVGTALLYMHIGDRWRVTIPAALAYAGTKSGSIPAYSTVIFEMELVGIYRLGTTPINWQ